MWKTNKIIWPKKFSKYIAAVLEKVEFGKKGTKKEIMEDMRHI